MNFRQLWVAFSGVLSKEVMRFMRGWLQTFTPSIVTTVLYFLVFGEVMGAKIGAMNGLTYTVFITPGLVMLAVITNSYSNVVSSFYGARFSRYIEEMLVSPMPNWLIIIGYCMGGVVRGLLVGVLVLTVALFFAHFQVAHAVLALLLMILCSALFSLTGFLNGMFARKFDDLVVVPTFILTPFIYLGGVFFSVDDLPSGWRFFAYVNPLHYLIDAFRYALLNVHPLGDSVALFLGVVIAFIVLLFGINLHLMNKGIGLKN